MFPSNNRDSANCQIPGGVFDVACGKHISSQVLCVRFPPSWFLLFHPQWSMWFPTHSVFYSCRIPLFSTSLSRLLGYQQESIAFEWIIDQIFSSTWPIWFDSHTCPFLGFSWRTGSCYQCVRLNCTEKVLLISRKICIDLWLFCWLEYEGVQIKLHFKEVCNEIH